MEPPFKNRNSKCCSSVAYQASNIQAISKDSDQSVRCWKSHVVAHIWTSWMLFIEMLRRAITDLFCFGAKSRVFVCFKAA